MKYQEKIFFTSQDIDTTQDAQGAELKAVANDSKYMFQEEKVKNIYKMQNTKWMFAKTVFYMTASLHHCSNFFENSFDSYSAPLLKFLEK